ncbi:MAG: pectate lyase [Bacilli bacterium]
MHKKRFILPLLFILSTSSLLGCKVNDNQVDNSIDNEDSNISNEETNNDNTCSDEQEEPIEEEKEVITKGTLDILKVKGYEEGLYVNFSKISSTKCFEVSYRIQGSTDEYIKIDDMLIREYEHHMRADILGLTPGFYEVKITSLYEDEGLNEDNFSTIENIKVTAQNREGFSFSNGHVPGAYKKDGTLKDNAIVLYVTNENKDTITCDIVTGSNSETLIGLQSILDGFKKGKDNRPISIRLIGEINDPAITLSGDIVIDGNNKYDGGMTLEGVGDDATINGWGIRIKNACNIEVKNLGFMNTDADEGDNIGIQQSNTYIWVHHNDLFYGKPGGDSDQNKGDGALDCKKSNYITMSYNHFFDSGKCSLLGNNDGENGYLVTYHHNWFDHSDSRHPRVRLYSAHVYNNYYDGNAKYGIGNTTGGSVFAEANYFRNCKYPMLISQQGSDIANGNVGTFSGEDGGIIKAFNNYIEGATRFVSYSEDNTQFDAYVVSSRDEQVPSTVTTYKGLKTYDNFDTNSLQMYEYEVQTPEEAKQDVIENAGRLDGGDIKFEFSVVDDADYGVNEALKTKLDNYKSSLVEVGFDNTSSQTPSEGGESNPSDSEEREEGNTYTDPVINESIEHNFTELGLTSSFFTITGNLSTSKGTVTYEDKTLTQCLKIESSTSINFTIDSSMTLTLVFNSSSTNIKIDGTKYTFTEGIFTKELEAGSHTITKADTANLYYIKLFKIE